MPVQPNENPPATLTPPQAADPNIITLAEYKDFMGILSTNTTHDAQVTALLGAASMAVRNYAGRSFVIATGPATPRTYLYDDSGILDTDDFTSVTAVSTDAGFQGQTYPLVANQYQSMPDNGPTFYWLLIYGFPLSGTSPEMGFTQNLDVYAREHNWYRKPTITVTATWGWNEIPLDVKLATAWTIETIVDQPDENLAAEAIESYSRSWASAGAAGAMLAVPNRARDLLSNYQRTF